MIKADVRVIHHSIFVAPWIANSLYAACEDESVSPLFIPFALGLKRREAQLWICMVESSHHKLVARFGYSRMLLHLFIEIFERVKGGLCIMAVVK